MGKNIRKYKITVNVITLGCSKNLVDSEVLLKQLDENDFIIAHNSSSLKHDIVIINTCGFINDAKQESIDTILQMVEAKRDGLVKKIIVAGCLSKRYREELENEITDVDAYFGVNHLKEIMNFIHADYRKSLLGERIVTTPKHYAYLKIAEGCDRKCSFCAIPFIRGRHVSKPMDVVFNEASLLAQKGVKELILVAQDLTYYGIDICKKRNLAQLLEKLSEVDGIEWIRLQYAYPASFPMDVVDVINEHKNICKYLDIPFQHINDRLLKSMNRAIDKKGTLKLIEKIRNKVPGIALRTSLIAGYPGETDKEFNELLQFVKDVKFERLGVFSYSHEESTQAFSLIDDVKPAVKKRRVERLMKLQESISLEKNQKLIGSKIKVLIDREEEEFFIGRTEFDSPEVDNEVIVKAPKYSLLVGQFRDIEISDADAYDIFGKLV